MKHPIDFMNMAYDLALKGWGHVSPNPMVGAVIVKSGKVIAEGWHAYYGGHHAEAMALKKAGAKAKAADLYVTLEPCGHFGKTPPCVQAVIKAGIKRVYVGVLDPNPIMNGKSIAVLRRAGIKVEVGFLKDELTSLNESFNHYMKTSRPFVTVKIAQTIDGKIANKLGASKWITSQASRDYAHEMRFGYDAIMVGINTVLKDDPALNSTPRKNMKKIILDTRLRMPVTGRIYAGTNPEDILVFTAAKKSKKIRATIIQAPLKGGKIDLAWVLKYLGEAKIANVLIEGGSALVSHALKSNLVDKMIIYTAPKIMGEGIDAIQGIKSQDVSKILKLKNVQVGRIGDDIYMEGYPTSHQNFRVGATKGFVRR